MHHQTYDRQFLLVPVAVLVIACLQCTTDTARGLAGLAWVLVALGAMGWFQRGLPWYFYVGATLLIALGAGFLYWYYTGGKALIHPIFDMQGVFESIQQTLEAPTPGG